MSPLVLLLAAIGITALAVVMDALARARRRRALRRLAAQWRMHYLPIDLLQLAPRIAGALPAPAAADVRVIDVLYAHEGDRYRYIFTAEYTRGATRAQKRIRQVASFSEPKEPADSAGASPLRLADPQLPLVDQYLQLHGPAGAEPGSPRS